MKNSFLLVAVKFSVRPYFEHFLADVPAGQTCFPTRVGWDGKLLQCKGRVSYPSHPILPQGCTGSDQGSSLEPHTGWEAPPREEASMEVRRDIH